MGYAINPEDLQFGEGDLYIANRNVGAFVEGNFELEPEFLLHESGTPRKINKRVPLSQTAQIAVTMQEINRENLRVALGLQTLDIEEVPAGPGTSEAEIRQMIGFEWIPLSNGDIYRINGVAQTASTTAQLTDTALSYDPGFFEGWRLTILHGAAAGESVMVTETASATALAVDPAFTVAPDDTSHYVLSPVIVHLSTLLIEDVAADEDTIYVENTDGFTISDLVRVGGAVGTLEIGGIDGNQITFTTDVGANFYLGDSVVNETLELIEGVDYIIDYFDGRIQRAYGSRVGSGRYISVNYAFRQYESTRIPLGRWASIPSLPVEARLLRDNGSMRIHFYRGQVGGGLNFAFSNEWHGIPTTIQALSDPLHQGLFGYVEIRYA